MRKFFLFSLFVLGLQFIGFSQQTDFNSLPKEIYAKVDANKKAGKPLFEGIKKTFDIEITKLDNSNFQNLLTALKSDKSVKNFLISDDKKTLQLVCRGDFQIEDVKKLIGAVNVEISRYTEKFGLE